MSECRCQHCNQAIDFPPAKAGSTVPCPHCESDTLLFVPAAETSPPRALPPRVRAPLDFWRVARLISWAVLAALVVTVCVVLIMSWGAISQIFGFVPSVAAGLAVIALGLFLLWLSIMWLFFPILVVQRLDRLIEEVRKAITSK